MNDLLVELAFIIIMFLLTTSIVLGATLIAFRLTQKRWPTKRDW